MQYKLPPPGSLRRKWEVERVDGIVCTICRKRIRKGQIYWLRPNCHGYEFRILYNSNKRYRNIGWHEACLTESELLLIFLQGGMNDPITVRMDT